MVLNDLKEIMITAGGTIFHYIFGGGLTIMNIYLTMVLLDISTGYIGALKYHCWQSAINFEGLFTKFGALLTIVAAAGLDKVGPILGIQLPVNIALIWTGLLCAYEFGSVLENASLLGVRIDWLMKWLAVFEEKLDGKDEKDGERDGE